MLGEALTSAATAFVTSAAIVASSGLHGRFTHDSTGGGPQKFHTKPVPRVGSLAILAGVVAALAYSIAFGDDAGSRHMYLWFIAVPALCIGLAEDLTHRVNAGLRLAVTAAAAGAAYVFLDARIIGVDLPLFDDALSIPLVSLLFTMFAVAGFSHAFNIVDGLNGLAGMVALLALAGLGFVAATVGDRDLLAVVVIIGGAVLGFLALNYPRGLIFLGDGGAYVLGFLIAVLAVLLTHRNSEVSPWFALVLLWYPVWETLFSMYRKRILRGQSPMQPDGLHLHMLVYKRLVRRNGKGGTGQNALAAVYLAVLCSAVVLPAMIMWDDTPALQGIAAVFTVFYLILYRGLVRFRFPRWLSARGSVHNGARRARRAELH